MDTAARSVYTLPQQAAEDKAAHLSLWLDAYATDILRLCCCYLGNRADAEDAMQETFLKAWRHMDQLNASEISHPKAWLMKIAVNTCRDTLRGPWYKKLDRTVDMDLLTSMQAAPQEDRDLLMDIALLPVRFKEVILLYYYQGMTIREIAHMLHCSEAGISRRITKACAMLKQAEEGEMT